MWPLVAAAVAAINPYTTLHPLPLPRFVPRAPRRLAHRLARLPVSDLRRFENTSLATTDTSSTMVYPHGLATPYVTPHILHKHYAQAFDAEPTNLVGRDLEYFSQAGFDMDRIQLKRNASVAQLYEDAIRNEAAIISSSGALINFSGKKTGRSPKDKRIVFEETSKDEIWWGSIVKIEACGPFPSDAIAQCTN